MCQEGSIGWTWPLNAINAGGRVPSFHIVRFDFRFCQSEAVNNIFFGKRKIEDQMAKTSQPIPVSEK